MNREEVAMNLTFENLDILRKEVEAAKLLLSECDEIFIEEGISNIELRGYLSGKLSADEVIELLDPPAEQRNQCDGCQAGIPLVDGAHRMGRPGGYPDLMSCQKERYKHPEQAEGAQGERERFEVEMLELCLPIERDSHGAYVSDHVRHLWSGWELRAALAQPSPAPELERPIAVAYRSSESGNLYEEHYGLKDPEPLMTVAQHDRIRAQDAAQIDAAAALLSFTRGKLVKLKSERDAAQDRVVELERQEPVATVCEVSMHHTGSTDVINTHLPCGTKLYANPVAQAGQVPEGKIVVSEEPLRRLLHALSGEPHLIRELQATRHPAALFKDNPINVLVAEYNAAPPQGGE